uniref:Uncharacterized protein n=2 Tax=Anguilla anguilla TaxID=7936 RepID=A0A0E9SFA1_ANGAN
MGGMFWIFGNSLITALSGASRSKLWPSSWPVPAREAPPGPEERGGGMRQGTLPLFHSCRSGDLSGAGYCC